MSWRKSRKALKADPPVPAGRAVFLLALLVLPFGLPPAAPVEGPQIHITARTTGGISPDGQRVYVVKETEGVITAPRIRITVRGLPVGRKVFLSCHFIPGPYRRLTELSRTPFILNPSGRVKLVNNRICQLTTGNRGTAEVGFRCEPYAGDRYILLLSRGLPSRVHRYPHRRQQRIMEKNALASRVFSIWKIMNLEPVKVLRGVRFPPEVMGRVADNLSRLNIEVRYSPDLVTLDPRDKQMIPYFSAADSTGPQGMVARYGPRLGVDMDFLMEMINRRFSDRRPDTLNIIIFGFQSRHSDLIRNSHPGISSVYGETPSRDLLDPGELNFNFQAVYVDQRGGQSPVIFCWSDFFYMAAHFWRVEHAALLTRAILHEIGHYLMRHSRPRTEELSGFDPQGHLREDILGGDTYIMSGISRSPARLRKFLKNLQWHPLTQRIFRRSFFLKPPEGYDRRTR